MPTKAEQYAQMADQVARQLTGSWQEWAGFLTTAARLYKYDNHLHQKVARKFTL